MKKLLALIFVALCTISIEAQEKYVAIERNAETGAYTLSKEFKAVLPLNEDGTYGDVATNKDSRGSVVVMKTASVTVEAVGGSTPAEVPDVAGDNTATHFDINPDGTVNSWNDIKWQQKSQGDINWAWILGTGTPAAKIEAEVIMTDDVPATYVDENGDEHTKYRPKYTYYNPDGSLGVPEVGLYYKVTATKNGSIKIGVWVNKGNRNTYVVDAATALPVAYKAMGYINGQNETYLQGDGTEASRKKYLTAEEIESIHKAAKVNAETGEDIAPYVIGAGNQPFFGHITFKMEAGKTYYVFCENTQLGFNGWIFDKYITFADSKVKEICVANWDTNSDGELSYAEAAAVTWLTNYFSDNTEITSFNELQYFTRLTTISSSDFNGCSNLASITIPNSVTRGNGAFSGCSALTSVTVGNSTPIKLTDDSTFSNRANATLYVPAGSKAAYEAASVWNEFKEIIEIENITFADSKVKEICVANWDTNGDGELSYAEAAVSSIGKTFKDNKEITSFDELQYFTGVETIEANAFYYCNSLVSVTLPNTVKEIQQNAFFKTSLESIKIPASVNTIEAAAFNACDKIKSIVVEERNAVYDSRNNCNGIVETATNTLIVGCMNTIIPDDITSIGESVFRGNHSLKQIVIPNSVTSIGTDAFYGCSALTSVTVGNSTPVELTDGNTFSNRRKATLYVPAGSKAAYEEASVWKEFKEIIEIENITFADSKVKEICVANWDADKDGELSYAEAAAVTSIGQVFDGNEEITSFNELQYFTGLTSIGDNAFYYCSGLTSVSIPSSVTSIGILAFFGCSGLTSIVIPGSVTSIGSSAFSGCSGLTSITVDADNPVYDSRNNCNAIIETATNELISGCKNTVIPSSVTSIGDDAFRGCSGLTGISIPSSVTSIGANAFSGCSSLTGISIPSSVTSIGNYAFGGCFGLTTITVEAGNPVYDSRNNCNAIIKTATNELISGCKNTVIPSSVTSIGDSAFSGCFGLTSISIPSSVTSIGNSAFSGCFGLTSISIPSSVTSIGGWAFYDCPGLTTITVEAGNPVYDSRNNCNAIIETATNELISGCKNTVIPSSVTSIGSMAFSNCFGLTSVSIPSSVTSIGDFAFSGCDGLTSISIPSSVTSIGYRAFSGCSGLTSIFIPSSVTSIGDYAFYRCSGLTCVTCKSSIPPSLGGRYVFLGTPTSTLYVPAGSKAAYEEASVWNDFKEIVPIATVTINKYGSGTYCSPYALDFTNVSGMKAYVAAGYNTTTNTVYMLSVKTAQPGEGLFIKGAPGDYTVPEIETSTDNYLNLLVGTTNEVTVNTQSDDGKYTNYAYSLNKGTDAPAFYKYSNGSKCMAYKAYLQIPTSWLPTLSEAKTVKLVFDDEEPTGIEEFRTEKDVEDVKIYDMQGRRVTKPGKGLYIVNGKKVVFK